jgi:hydrogenase nickel incorporation protein HypA/HybF
MHEASLAQLILGRATDEAAARGNRRIRQLGLRVGTASNVEVESLRFALERLASGGSAAGARVDVEVVPLRLRCGGCGWEGETPPWSYRCAACRSPDVEVVSGRELQLIGLELDDEEA